MRILAAAAAAATVLGVALLVASDGVRGAASWGVASPVVSSLVLVGVGAPLARRPLGRRVGLLLLGAGTVMAVAVAGGGYAAYGGPRGWPAVDAVDRAASEWLWALAVVPVTTVLLAVFPDGRPPSARWRPLLWLGWTATGLLAVGSALGSSTLAVTVGGPLWTAAGLGGIAALTSRWTRSGGVARQQVKYLLLAGVLVAVLYAIADLLPYHARQVAFLTVPLALVGAVGLAVMRYRLYDIDLVIRRTAVFVGVTGVVFAAYLAVAAAFGTDASERAALVAAAVVAAIAEPARRRLQQAITRLLVGRRDDPLGALAVMRDRLRDANDERELGATVTDVVATLVRTRSVRMELLVDGDARKVGSRGTPGPDAIRLPLIHQSELLGTLVVGLRDPGSPFGRADTVLLIEIAHQVAAAAHAVRLRGELRAAAERVLRAAAEERERLRREIHDRLGPLLLGTGLTVDALRRGPVKDATADGLAEVADQLRSASAEVRRIVDQLQPAALLELGLTAAVAEHVARLSALPGVPVFRLEVEEVGQVAPPVQEAAYFLLLEAVTNVLRHAGAGSCTVGVRRRDGRLETTVEDDGRGLADPYVAGVGIGSMRRRVLELGGSFAVGPGPAGGTRVAATFPLEEVPWVAARPSASSSPTTTPSSGSACAVCSTRSPASTSSGKPPTPTQRSLLPSS